MDCAPWLRSSTREFLYSFSHTNDEYLLLATDMASVFEERLNAAQIERRGEQLNCPFALDSERQRKAFGEVLATLLAAETALFNINVDSTVVVHATEDVPFHWRFELSRLAPDRCSEVFAIFTAKLFGVIDNLGAHISRLDERIADSSALIRGLEGANARQIRYNVPKPLEAVYNSALSASLYAQDSPDAIVLAEKYWPTGTVSLVEKAVIEETDSDATHESLTTSSSENVWAGSTKPGAHEDTFGH